jgi:hypothetical protein
MRATLHVGVAPPDSIIHVVFTTDDPARYFWAAVPPQRLVANPAQLFLASQTLTRVGEPTWDQVKSLLLRIRSPSASECDIRVSDLRIVTA